MSYRSIAIDGPSGAGKSTLARMLAQELGFLYVDTGAIYRTIGLAVFRRGGDPSDAAQVLPLLNELDIGLRYEDDGVQHMFLNGEDVTQAIRQNAVSQYTSQVSALPEVRAFLLERQRELARTQDVIMDGRAIGTVVLTQADVKIFLTASPEDRAQRRYAELIERGQEASFASVLQDVKERDARDTGRAAAPLRQAEDARRADTSGLTLEESLRLLLDIIKETLQV